MNVTIDFAVYKDLPDGSESEAVYEIECDLTPGTPDVPYLKGGDPGYPGDPAEFEILSVKLNGTEIRDWESLFDRKTQEMIEAQAWEEAPSKDDDDDPRGWEPGGD